ncbi:MAG: response regulator [Desulfobacterales bacterium]|jgi:putative nucleotidyltransferase with HDIG domain|nr:response regulator [Desulfobacteraceae bacterium]MDY0312420.1 response regulator [Desulfobacterales bacterium]
MAHILITDDEILIRQMLSQMLTAKGHSCTMAKDPAEARMRLKETAFDLILCDINMPGEDGMMLMRDILPRYPDTAAIMVTGVDDHIIAEQFFELGVYDYLTKPIDHTRVLIAVANALRRQELERINRQHQAGLESLVAQRTRALQEMVQTKHETLVGMVHAIDAIVENRDPYTAGHQRRVAELARAMAVKLKMSAAETEGIFMGGLIHDVGKIAVPSEILSKPGRLSTIEFELIKRHTSAGYEIVRDIPFDWPIADIVYQHHEKMDGSGYPRQLTGSEIAPEARIICVADVVEAMASHRPYRPAVGIEAALADIRQHRGRRYDPDAVRVCLELFEKDGYQFE